MPPFEEMLKIVQAEDERENRMRGFEMVVIILPDNVAPEDICDELNAYSDANIRVTENDDEYLHELILAA